MTQRERQCPALFISAPASGQGKTTVTAALARYHRNRGCKVRIFKTGPDFLDPMILEQAAGAAVYPLDLWMGGADHCRALLYHAAADADLILIEGVMGLFDGTSSSADLARFFGIPVMAVIDGSAMAQTFGALAHGLANYCDDLPFAGLFANRVGSEGHYQMLADSVRPPLTTIGWLAHDDEIKLPERHLGLVQADEVADLESRINRAAAALNHVPDQLPPAVTFTPAATRSNVTPSLQGVQIAVAKDAAFAFIYHANLDLLRAHGAEITFFSPLSDTTLPAADALYLPGGYPELHLNTLANNQPMKAAITQHQMEQKPIVAECGGMLYLLNALTAVDGQRATMVGLLPGEATMQKSLSNIGMQRVQLPEGELRGHTFHHSSTTSEMVPLTHSLPARHHGKPEAVYRRSRLTASYLHLYFPSNPDAAVKLFQP